MKRPFMLIAVIASLLLVLDIDAQTRTSSTSNTGKTTTAATTTNTGTNTSTGNNKVEKTLNQTTQTLDNAKNTKETAQKTFEDVVKMFKPKTVNEALIVIPGIEFEDENLNALKKAIEGHKDVKKASVDYTDGTATISVTLKGKEKADFWIDLPKEIRDVFKMKNKKENSILLEYKNAVKQEPAPATNSTTNDNSRNNSHNSEQLDLATTDKKNTKNETSAGKQEQKKNNEEPIGRNPPKQSENFAVTGKPDKPVPVKGNVQSAEPAVKPIKKDPVPSTTQNNSGSAGAIDLGFGNPVKQLADSSRFDGRVRAIVTQPNGKMIFGGDFNTYNKFSSSCIIRLEADGNIDKNFGVATGFDGQVSSLVLQQDGKVIAGGKFTSYNGKGNPCPKIARLNTDGSIDKTFTSTPLRGEINTLVLQPDGKILIGSAMAGTNTLTRLNNDGSPDVAFNNTQQLTGEVHCIAVLPGGKIMVGGSFSRFGDVFSTSIVRLNSDGSMDNNFIVGKSIAGAVLAIAPLPNGKVVIGGNIRTYDKNVSWNIMRLNNDGSFDNSFTAPQKPQKYYAGWGIFCIDLQSDGKMIIGGRFEEYNGSACNNIARINADGSFDPTYLAGAGADNESGGVQMITVMTRKKDGKLVVGGYFEKFDEVLRNHVAGLNKDGKLDNTFNVSSSFDRGVSALALLKNGKILAAGEFRTYNGITRIGLACLLPNGMIDENYNISSNGFNKGAEISSIAVQPDGKIIAAGKFITYEGVARRGITRLNADGSLDNTFYTGVGFDQYVKSIVLQPDGKIIAIGEFRNYDGNRCEKIVRLNADGRIDNTFEMGEGIRGFVYSLALQKDGKILIGGQIFEYNKTRKINLLRLNPDGSIDEGFVPFKDMDPLATSIVLQDDGKIVVAGRFGILGNIKGTRIVRLRQDGSLDTTFNWKNVYAVMGSEHIGTTLQPDGKMVVFGNFTHINDKKVAARIIRLNTDGSFDNSFNAGEGFLSSNVNTVVQQPDGKLIAAGGFKSYNTYMHPGIVRIYGR